MPSAVRVRLEEAVKYKRLLQAEETADRALAAGGGSTGDEDHAAELTQSRLLELRAGRDAFEAARAEAASPLHHIPVLTAYAQSAPPEGAPARVSLHALDLELEAMRLEEEIRAKRKALALQRAEHDAFRARDDRALAHLHGRIAEYQEADRIIDNDALPDVRERCRLIREQHKREKIDAERERLRFKPKAGSPWCGDGTGVRDPVSREALASTRPAAAETSTSVPRALRNLCAPRREHTPGEPLTAVTVDDITPPRRKPGAESDEDVSPLERDRRQLAKRNASEVEEILRMRTLALDNWQRSESAARSAIERDQAVFHTFATASHTLAKRELRSRGVMAQQWKLGADNLRGAMARAEDVYLRAAIQRDIDAERKAFAVVDQKRDAEVKEAQIDAARTLAAKSRALDEAYRQRFRDAVSREEAARRRLLELDDILDARVRQLDDARQRLQEEQAQDAEDDVTRATTIALEQRIEYQEVQLEALRRERAECEDLVRGTATSS